MKLRNFLVAGLVLLAVSVFLVRQFGGPSEARVADLEADWERVVEWAQLEEAGTQHAEFHALLDSLDESDDACIVPMRALRELLEQARSSVDEGSSGAPLIVRANLDPDVEALLKGFETHCVEGRTAVPGVNAPVHYTLGALQLAELALYVDDLDAERLGHILRFVERLWNEGPLTHLALGHALGRRALDVVEGRPRLGAALAAVRPPEREEYFAALCRDFVTLDAESGRMTLDREYGDGSARFAGFVMRRGVTNVALRFAELRGTPERFGEVPGPPAVTPLWLWLSAFLRREALLVEQTEALVQLGSTVLGGEWADFVDDWSRRAAERAAGPAAGD